MKNKKIIINFIIFVILCFITFFVVFKNTNIKDMIHIINNHNFMYVILGILLMFIYFILEAINMKRILKSLNDQTSFLRCIKYTFICFFFSSITPGSTGGQPMLAYYMHKDKVKLSSSSLVLLINLASFQTITLFLSIFGIIINYNNISFTFKIFFVIGFSLNVIVLSLSLILIFSRKLKFKIINIFIKILYLFKLKNIEEKNKKLQNELVNFENSYKYILNNKLIIFKTIITTFFQVIVLYSIPYVIYLSFHFNSVSYFTFLSLQAIFYASVASIPLPGSVAVSEGGFLGIFKNVFLFGSLQTAMIIYRLISFYLFVIISQIIVILNIISLNKRK